MARWKKLAKTSIVVGAAGGTALAGGYGIAAAAVPSSSHHAGRTIAGKVTAVTDGGFTVTTRRGATDPVLTTSSTRYHESGSPVPPAGVTTGEHVIVFLTGPARGAGSGQATATTAGSTAAGSNTTGSTATDPTASAPTAAVVDIVLDSERGVVTTTSGGTITLGGRDHGTRTVDVTGSTTYYQDGKATTASAVQPGVAVATYGTRSSAGVLDASIVDVFATTQRPQTARTDDWTKSRASTGYRPFSARTPSAGTAATTAPTSASTPTTEEVRPQTSPSTSSSWSRVSGRVTSVSGDIITVSRPEAGSTPETVTVTASTRYYEGEGRAASLSSVAPGDLVTAVGTETGAEALTASVVDIHQITTPAYAGTRTGDETNRTGSSPQATPYTARSTATAPSQATAPAPDGDSTPSPTRTSYYSGGYTSHSGSTSGTSEQQRRR